jgi:hypothetical protein
MDSLNEKCTLLAFTHNNFHWKVIINFTNSLPYNLKLIFMKGTLTFCGLQFLLSDRVRPINVVISHFQSSVFPDEEGLDQGLVVQFAIFFRQLVIQAFRRPYERFVQGLEDGFLQPHGRCNVAILFLDFAGKNTIIVP